MDFRYRTFHPSVNHCRAKIKLAETVCVCVCAVVYCIAVDRFSIHRIDERQRARICTVELHHQPDSVISLPLFLLPQDPHSSLQFPYLTRKLRLFLRFGFHYILPSTTIRGHAVAQLVEAPRFKSEGRGFDSRWCHWNFSLT